VVQQPAASRPVGGPAIAVTDDRGRPRGVVAAGHPATVEAAVGALQAGGNAYDAAVAAGFAAAVAEPCLSSLGGGGFLLARTSADEQVLFDFFVDTPGRGREGGDALLTPVVVRFPGADQVFHVGHGSVAVPGCLTGYLHVHRRLGRLELDRIVAPARRLAEQGVVLGREQAAVVRLLRPIFSLTAAGRQRFVPEDRPFADDDVYVNPPLAAFLDDIADGRVTGFDDVEVAVPIAADMAAHGGLLTAADLGAYRVLERDPLVVAHGGAQLITNPAPSFGGRLIAHALRLLGDGGVAGPAGSGGWLVQLADVQREVTAAHTGQGPMSVKGTTHVSIADAEGNLASMTTSNGSGSGVVLGATGVFANNIMGEEDLHPAGLHTMGVGVRVGSMMAPSVLLRAGRPPVVLGSGGSERIRSAITQVVANLVDHALELGEAIAAPRIHWNGAAVQVEPGLDPAAVAELASRHPVNVWSEPDLYFGGVHAVSPDGARVGDRRRGGRTALLGADGGVTIDPSSGSG
jgi:gamma-glutamyltranspeptidase / glutathione hydrolase